VGLLHCIVLMPAGTASWRVAAQEPQDDGGTLSFTDITIAAGMESSRPGSHGAFWADATGDGRPDLFLTFNECRSGLAANRFYRNLGGGVFSGETPERGLYRLTGGSHGGSWADLDNDGDYDLITGDTYASDCTDPTKDPAAIPNTVYRNDGGFFTDVTAPDILAYPPPGSVGEGYTRSILGFDMDRDGDLDIFAVNGDRGSYEPFPDRNELYRNDGGFSFRAITTGPLITTPAGQAGADTDYDGDGDVDILVPDYGRASLDAGDLGVLRNDGNGVFTKVPRQSIGIGQRASTGISSGDLNNDGRTDLILIDQDRDPFRRLGFDRIAYVYLNAGGGTFTFLGEIRNIPGFTAGLADLDNDGDLDLTFPGYPNVLLNDGSARFSVGPFYPTPTPPPGCSGADCLSPDIRTVSFADIDDDGDLDSVVTTKFGPFYLIRNNYNTGNWLKVRLTSPQGQAGAFGAKVRIYRAGTQSLITWREAKNVYGYLSQDDPVLHFGLGANETVDVDVTYLDGSRVTRRGVSARQTIAFVGTTTPEPPLPARNLSASVVGSSVTLTWEAPLGGPAPTSYQIEAGSATGLSNLGAFQVGLATTISVAAAPGTYYVRVRSRNAFGVSAPSNEVVVVVGSGCSLPTAPGTLVGSVSGSVVTLSWTPPTGPTPLAYSIEVGASAGASDLVIINTGSPIVTLTASAPPGRYFVRVRAQNACGLGAPSNELTLVVP
jgi:hypothetical protein